jgi:hypothetical protein
MHFPHFFGNAPTTSRQGTLPFYKNKNRGNLCQNLKNYILTYHVISNKFTIVQLCTLQRNYIHFGTRHRFPNPIKYPGRFMEWIKRRVTSSYKSTLSQLRKRNTKPKFIKMQWKCIEKN